MENNLAIIIPAYKSTFLKETLDSFVNQTNQNFTIYIGDDASPNNIEEIVNEYLDKLAIVYHRFEDNMGAQSLTKQWERCIELSSEQWIWLFSDDDIVDADCIENFYLTQTRSKYSKLFKFFTKMIDNKSNEINLYKDNTNRYKEIITADDFITNRLTLNRFRSYVVEYIFHRSIYSKYKFIDFPLAWASDDATWYTYASANNGITIIDSYVSWRFSGENISSNTSDSKTIIQKRKANQVYFQWLIHQNLYQDKRIIILKYISNQYIQLYKDFKKAKEFLLLDYNNYYSESEINQVLKKLKRELYFYNLLGKIKKIIK